MDTLRKIEEKLHTSFLYESTASPPNARLDAKSSKTVFGEFEAKNFYRTFVLGNTISQGALGKVFKAALKDTGPQSPSYAVKRVFRFCLSTKHKAALFEEVRILRELSHPHIISIHQFYREDPIYYFVVMEHLTGGELFDRVVTKNSYSEKDARDLCVLLINTIDCCHSHGIVHRDIRPANILLVSPDDNAIIKLAGFSSACSVLNGPVVTQSGTPEFRAPEILLGKPHGTSVDMWGIGLIAYMLLGGRHPFFEKDTTKMFIRVAAGDYDCKGSAWDNISSDAEDFVRKLLVVDPEKRITAKEATTHPWLMATGQSLANRDLGNNLQKFKVFNAKRKLRAMFKTYMAAKRLMGPLTPEAEEGDGDFSSAFTLGHKLGQGAFATVFVATPKSNSQGGGEAPCYAVKRIDRKGLSKEDEGSVFDEVYILRDLEHPNVVNIYNFYDNHPDYYYMVLELMEGGELFDRIVQKTYYNEEEARDVCRILLGAVKYIHSQHIVHRDLKPENLLLSSKTDDSSIRVADFGFACSVRDGFVSVACGTPAYAAPEIIKGIPYGTSVDMWSTGVIIYIILAGYPPFHDQNQTRLFRKIKAGSFKFEPEYWGGVSDDAKDLVRKLLRVDPQKRLTASEAYDHPWLKTTGQSLADNNLGDGLQKLRIFNARTKFRAAIKTVVAARIIRKLA